MVKQKRDKKQDYEERLCLSSLKGICKKTQSSYQQGAKHNREKDWRDEVMAWIRANEICRISQKQDSSVLDSDSRES